MHYGQQGVAEALVTGCVHPCGGRGHVTDVSGAVMDIPMAY
jgi:hypothetical protein